MTSTLSGNENIRAKSFESESNGFIIFKTFFVEVQKLVRLLPGS